MTVATVDSLAESLCWEHERVHLINEPETGLEAVIAIHSTVLGPALGGLRVRDYEGGTAAALDDALRLSRAMTLKAAAAGLNLGGGKAVIVDRVDAGSLLERLAAFAGEVERLNGDYITAEDIGTTTADMDFIAEHTTHVVGCSERDGFGGDPSPDTARTVFGGIRAALEALDGSPSLDGRRVGVIGLGKVGSNLAGLLADAEADVLAFDPRAVARDGCGDGVTLAASLQEVLSAELDVLAPCAVGGLIDPAVAAALNCRVLCGAANNPLGGPQAASVLARREILYVPDFLANSGGLIHVDAERLGETGERLELKLVEAERRTGEILAEALERGELPATIAEERAWSRIRAVDASVGTATQL